MASALKKSDMAIFLTFLYTVQCKIVCVPVKQSALSHLLSLLLMLVGESKYKVILKHGEKDNNHLGCVPFISLSLYLLIYLVIY